MDTQELKAAAKELGYSLNQGWPGPIWILMNRHHGGTVGTYRELEEVAAVLEDLPPSSPRVVDAVPVGWSVVPQLPPPLAPRCPNGYGACLCLDTSFLYFCPVIGCQRPARCLGTCDEHYAHARLYGDVTDLAVRATEAMIVEYLEEDADGLSTYDRALSNFNQGILSHVNLKYADMQETGGASTSLNGALTVLTGLPGVLLRILNEGTPSQVYALMDRSGNILSQHTNRQEMLAAFSDE